MVGTVLAAGEASGVTEGSTVLSHTRHQSVARFDHRERLCVPLPAGLGVDVAPLARLAQVGGVSLQLAAARPGDSVAVIGLGPLATSWLSWRTSLATASSASSARRAGVLWRKPAG